MKKWRNDVTRGTIRSYSVGISSNRLGVAKCTQEQRHCYFRSIFVFACKPHAVSMCSAMRLHGFAVRRMVAQSARIVLLALTTVTVCCGQEERKAIWNSTPAYPAFARGLNLSGTEKTKAVVSTDGQVKQWKW